MNCSFFQKRASLFSEKYQVSNDDKLRMRIKTTSIKELKFQVLSPEGTKKFTVLDPGGMRSERKKWIHIFENVSSLIFCANLSQFDQSLTEDSTVNVFDETFNLWREISNLNWFTKSSRFVLVFTHFDIFQKKVSTNETPFQTWGYTESQSWQKILNFILNKYCFQYPDRDLQICCCNSLDQPEMEGTVSKLFTFFVSGDKFGCPFNSSLSRYIYISSLGIQEYLEL